MTLVKKPSKEEFEKLLQNKNHLGSLRGMDALKYLEYLRPASKNDAWAVGICTRCSSPIMDVAFLGTTESGPFCSRSCRDNVPTTEASLAQKRRLRRRTKQAQAARVRQAETSKNVSALDSL